MLPFDVTPATVRRKVDEASGKEIFTAVTMQFAQQIR